MHDCMDCVWYPSLAGCSPPTPPVNGSVSGFTSSRVGAQVTYHCDTDLVLVGERVATCSQSSLQWLPNSEDVICMQPSGKVHINAISLAIHVSTHVQYACTVNHNTGPNFSKHWY